MMPGERAHNDKPDGERQHVDPGPERCRLETVAVQGQPDPLEQDDQDDHHPAPGKSGEEAGPVPEGKVADLEEIHTEHRVFDPCLDNGEGDKEQKTTHERSDDPRVSPAHGRAAVREQGVGDADKKERQAADKGEVPPDVDLLGTVSGRPAL